MIACNLWELTSTSEVIAMMTTLIFTLAKDLRLDCIAGTVELRCVGKGKVKFTTDRLGTALVRNVDRRQQKSL